MRHCSGKALFWGNSRETPNNSLQRTFNPNRILPLQNDLCLKCP